MMHAGATQLGPSLFGVFGRPAGAGAGEIQQQAIMGGRATAFLWNDCGLMRYLKDPYHFRGANFQRNFKGIEDFQARVDIAHFLKTLCAENESLINPPERPFPFLY
ncbi:unnamed protein product [Polarella glacialis]|uniref:Uncharacterized protein n=1 Tax=Polarella glacialis TaxID=89957 RepID=A0A813M0Q0_POLGL|nr:unnamed protein product [Polarella glacialis]